MMRHSLLMVLLLQLLLLMKLVLPQLVLLHLIQHICYPHLNPTLKFADIVFLLTKQSTKNVQHGQLSPCSQDGITEICSEG